MFINVFLVYSEIHLEIEYFYNSGILRFGNSHIVVVVVFFSSPEVFTSMKFFGNERK